MDKAKAKPGKTQKKKKKFTSQFIGNKESGQGFADKRKKKAFYEYKKLMSKMKASQAQVVEGSKQTVPVRKRKNDKSSSKDQALNRYSKAQQKSLRDQQERTKRKEEVNLKRKQQTEALSKYKQKKDLNFRKLCKRNFKGQPVMKNQIEYLLQKIQDQS